MWRTQWPWTMARRERVRRIVLAEKQLDYEMTVVDLRKHEQLEPWFVALNPFHKVPVLIDEDDDGNYPTLVRFTEPEVGVSPGQACVVYDAASGSRVLGGGFIRRFAS